LLDAISSPIVEFLTEEKDLEGTSPECISRSLAARYRFMIVMHMFVYRVDILTFKKSKYAEALIAKALRLRAKIAS
jgi:hypothetical protein